MLRLFVDGPLNAGTERALPAEAARHVQVLRHQPGDVLTLFDGHGGEWRAEVVSMGRRDVSVRLIEHLAVDRELPGHVLLAVGMPANERFDWLVEKATELGAHAIQPLMCERSVLRVSGERAERKAAHWQAVAVAAAEQSGRTQVPPVRAPLALGAFLQTEAARAGHRRVLSLKEGAGAASIPAWPCAITLLSGPEGGLSSAEEAAALAQGFEPVTLGPRVLRAETAPLAYLAWLGGQGLP